MARLSETLLRVRSLVAEGRFLISDHGYDEFADDAIYFDELLASLARAVVVEDYPAATRGPSVLVLEYDGSGRPAHVVWGIPKGQGEPAVLITAYRPDPREGRFAAEVPVELIEDESGWSPYLSAADATKLDAVRRALRAGDVAAAARHGRVFELLPVSA